METEGHSEEECTALEEVLRQLHGEEREDRLQRDVMMQPTGRDAIIEGGREDVGLTAPRCAGWMAR